MAGVVCVKTEIRLIWHTHTHPQLLSKFSQYNRIHSQTHNSENEENVKKSNNKF